MNISAARQSLPLKMFFLSIHSALQLGPRNAQQAARNLPAVPATTEEPAEIHKSDETGPAGMNFVSRGLRDCDALRQPHARSLWSAYRRPPAPLRLLPAHAIVSLASRQACRQFRREIASRLPLVRIFPCGATPRR